MSLRRLLRIGIIAHAIVLIAFGFYFSIGEGQERYADALPYIDWILHPDPNQIAAAQNTCIGGTCQAVDVEPVSRISQYELYDKSPGFASSLVMIGFIVAGFGVALTKETQHENAV